MTFRFTSLRTALLLPSVGLVLIVALAIGALSYVTGQRAAAAVVEQLLRDTTERLNENIQTYIATPAMLLNVVAPDPERFVPGATASIDDLTDYTFAGIERRLWLASGLATGTSGYVYYGGADGRFVGVSRSAAGVEVRVKASPDAQRSVYRSSGPGLRGDLLRRDNFDPKQRPWYQAAVTRDAVTWSPVYVDATTKSLTLTLAKPIRDSKGAMHGVVATDLPLSQLAEYVGRLRVSDNGVVFIVDSNGTLVAGSQNASLVAKVGAPNTRVNASESDIRLIRETHQTLAVKKEFSEKQATHRFSFESDNEAIDASVTRISDANGLNWHMVIAVPRNDHLGALKRTAFNNAAIAALAVLLAIVLGLWFSHRIGSDVRRLSEATRLLAQGESLRSLNLERNDELGVMARSMRELSSALLTDPLTGVFNRSTFEKRAAAYLEKQRARKSGKVSAIIFVDLNAFKRINDSHGHSVGDAVLALAAQRLSRGLRDGDFIGRLGGDEFVLFLRDVDGRASAERVVARCRAQLGSPLLLAGAELHVEAAFGLAIAPNDGNTVADLLAQADRVMYRDKYEQLHPKNDSTGAYSTLSTQSEIVENHPGPSLMLALEPSVATASIRRRPTVA